MCCRRWNGLVGMDDRGGDKAVQGKDRGGKCVFHFVIVDEGFLAKDGWWCTNTHDTLGQAVRPSALVMDIFRLTVISVFLQRRWIWTMKRPTAALLAA